MGEVLWKELTNQVELKWKEDTVLGSEWEHAPEEEYLKIKEEKDVGV